MPKGIFINVETGERVERDLTDAELAAIARDPAAVAAETAAELVAGRRGAYQAEADPLFFKWQRGEGTEQAWLDKVAEIRERFPDA